MAAYDLCACAETLDEPGEVLERDKFDRYLNRLLRRDFVALIRRNSRLFSIEDIDLASIERPCRDAKDTKFLALALASETDMLVSSDEDLLVLPPWHEPQIVTPGKFLSRSEAMPKAQETT